MDRSIILKYLLDSELDKRISQPNSLMAELMGNVIEWYDKLSAALDPKLLSKLENYRDSLDSYHAEEVLHTIAESFIAGLQFGLALKVDPEA